MPKFKKSQKKVPAWLAISLIILAGLFMKYLFEEAKYMLHVRKVQKTTQDIFSRR
ncbi:MAG TPA: hypothetical protein VMW66_06335 [Elusimicrobiales bacterium]|nr:hypothetical protein [Elusimicrobiales bacterium]